MHSQCPWQDVGTATDIGRDDDRRKNRYFDSAEVFYQFPDTRNIELTKYHVNKKAIKLLLFIYLSIQVSFIDYRRYIVHIYIYERKN